MKRCLSFLLLSALLHNCPALPTYLNFDTTEKIMQPFFTTKPTGEGTGLGLSLTYDMVVKGYAGSIEVNTKEGQYTEFIIKLPIQ